MSMHIALLRAVNVGGRGKIKMAELRAMAEAMGLERVATVLQSGNLVFNAAPDAALEARLERQIEQRFAIKSAVIVRSSRAWAGIIAENPFGEAAAEDPSHLLVMLLKTAPLDAGEHRLQAAIKGRETVRVIGQTAYLVYPDGVGDSKLTTAVIERHLGAQGTARNWNTVEKLAAIAAA